MTIPHFQHEHSRLTIKLIDQQDDFIVVEKPENINFHDEGALGQGFFSQIKAYAQSQLHLSTLFPVHRLDKMTSGLMLFATNKQAATRFQHLFAQGHIEKYYLAIAQGKPKKKQGLIKGDMVKSRRGMWKLLRSNENPAITHFFSYSIATKTRLYLLKPYTGKTHQLRVALNSIGTAIWGDELYHRQLDDKANLAADRGYLHAYGIHFCWQERPFQYCLAPSSGKLFTDSDTQQVIADIAEPWRHNWPSINK